MAKRFFSSTSWDDFVSGIEALKAKINSKADSSHTHSYAGSSSVGGAATSANKLNTNAGSTTQPIYFTNGVPAATTYALNATVPSGAKFTDTVYTHPSYTARTGKPTGNLTPAFGGTATISQITSDATGHVTGATDRTITIPSTLSNGSGTAGLIKTSSTVTSNSGYTACPVISGVPYYKDTNTTYTLSSFGIAATAAEINKLSGATVTTAELNILDGVTATAAEINTLDGITATVTELNYCDGVTSNIQTQLNGKAATHSHPYMSNSPVSIELNSSGSLSGYGGFIDFHFNGSTKDYTSRIIENAEGTLSINSVTITSGKVVTATTFTGTNVILGNATLSYSSSDGALKITFS